MWGLLSNPPDDAYKRNAFSESSLKKEVSLDVVSKARV